MNRLRVLLWFHDRHQRCVPSIADRRMSCSHCWWRSCCHAGFWTHLLLLYPACRIPWSNWSMQAIPLHLRQREQLPPQPLTVEKPLPKFLLLPRPSSSLNSNQDTKSALDRILNFLSIQTTWTMPSKTSNTAEPTPFEQARSRFRLVRIRR